MKIGMDNLRECAASLMHTKTFRRRLEYYGPVWEAKFTKNKTDFELKRLTLRSKYSTNTFIFDNMKKIVTWTQIREGIETIKTFVNTQPYVLGKERGRVLFNNLYSHFNNTTHMPYETIIKHREERWEEAKREGVTSKVMYLENGEIHKIEQWHDPRQKIQTSKRNYNYTSPAGVRSVSWEDKFITTRTTLKVANYPDNPTLEKITLEHDQSTLTLSNFQLSSDGKDIRLLIESNADDLDNFLVIPLDDFNVLIERYTSIGVMQILDHERKSPYGSCRFIEAGTDNLVRVKAREFLKYQTQRTPYENHFNPYYTTSLRLLHDHAERYPHPLMIAFKGQPSGPLYVHYDDSLLPKSKK